MPSPASNVIAFRPRQPAADAAAPAKKPARRRVAKLVLNPLLLSSQKLGSEHFSATLSCEGHEVQYEDGRLAGVAAYVLHARIIELHMPSSPGETFGMSSSPKLVPGLTYLLRQLRSTYESDEVSKEEAVRKQEEALFVQRAHAAWRQCVNSNKLDASQLEDVQALVDQVALTLPESLRTSTRLERGVFDADGQVLSAADIARAARNRRTDERLARVIAGKSDSDSANAQLAAIDWTLVSVDPDDARAPIALNGSAYMAVQRVLYGRGFQRMPQSWAELERALTFCWTVGAALDMASVADGEADRLLSLKCSVDAMRGMHPEHVELFEAAVFEDEKSLKELHAQRDWLEVLGADYRPENDQLLKKRPEGD